MTASRGSSWWTAGWTGRTPAGRRRKSSGSSTPSKQEILPKRTSNLPGAAPARRLVRWGTHRARRHPGIWGNASFCGVSTPEEASKALAAVTRERVVAAAERVTLESVYLLTQEPEGEGSDNA